MMETLEKRLEVTHESWAVQSIRLRAKYPELEAKDVQFAPGKKALMLKKLALTLGVSPEAVTVIISKL